MNGGGVLKVNPRALQNVGSSFGQTGDGLAGLQADAPLGDAAGAVPQLETGDACRKAQIDVAAKIKIDGKDVNVRWKGFDPTKYGHDADKK